MATVARAAEFPHVLLVTGDDVITGDYRANLIDVLQRPDSTDPVRTGTHEFWITFEIGSNANPDHAWVDPSVRPRMRLGIVQMADPPAASDVDTLRGPLVTALHELGHAWLVPPDLTVRSDEYWPGPARSAPGMDGYDGAIAFTDGSPFWGPQLHARQRRHWSVWVHTGGGANMDDVPWRRAGSADGLARWDAATPSPVMLRPAGLPEMALPVRFGDADLVLIGALRPEEAFPGDRNRLHWMEPRLMAPLEYQAGLITMFDAHDAIYFGFHGDHRQLAVQRLGEEPVRIAAPENNPFPDESRAVALRMIRRGGACIFQARYSGFGRDLGARHVRDAGAWPPRSEGPLGTDWTTVDERIIPEPPKAVGLAVRTWRPILCEAHFQNLELAQGSTESALQTGVELPTWSSPTAGLESLPAQLVKHVPLPGARIRRRRGVTSISTPYAQLEADGQVSLLPSFEHTATDDSAPKLLTAAPTGDFVVATTARVDRSGLSPWAGGAAGQKTLWGIEHSAAMADVVTGPEHTPLQTPPPDNTYRSAFIIVARNTTDIRSEQIRAVDTLRRYFDAAVRPLMRGRRESDTTL